MKELDGYKILYLEYLNDYLTVEKFAEHHNLTVDEADHIISVGRDLCNTDG